MAAPRQNFEYPGTPDATQQHHQNYFPPDNAPGQSKREGDEKGSFDDAEVRHGAARASGPGGVASGELHRSMKARHIQMISIGGVIGTGLFLGTANSLRHGGPLGLLLGYTVMGTVVWCVMSALGEMVAHLPIAGGHISLAHRFVDPALSFTMGWNYWYNWTIVLPAELSAAAIIVGYWNKSVNPAVWITIFLVIVGLINLGGARFYAEFEFWFASIKVITIVGLIIVGIIIDAGGGPNGDAKGFRYWRNPGAFVQYEGIGGTTGRFLGFWAVLIQASFSYIGTEITAITAGEAQNPKKSLPKAIRNVGIRIMLFYILGTFVIGISVASNDPRLELGTSTAASSPFVIAIEDAGIKILPSIINAALLSSAWSAASSDLYTSSRALYGLALAGSAPSFLKRTTSWGLPIGAYAVGVLFSLLSYMSAGTDGAGKVFNYFANMTSVAGLLTWCGILITHIRFDKGVRAQKIDRSIFPYKAVLRQYGSYYALVACCVILFFNSWHVFLNSNKPFPTSDFITGYLPVFMFPLLYIGSRIWYKYKGIDASPIKPMAMDFYTNARDDDRDIEEAPPVGLWNKVKAWA